MISYKHIHKAMLIARTNWMQSREAARTAHSQGMYKAWSHWMRKAKMHKAAYKILAWRLHNTLYLDGITKTFPSIETDWYGTMDQAIALVDYYYPAIIRPQAG